MPNEAPCPAYCVNRAFSFRIVSSSISDEACFASRKTKRARKGPTSKGRDGAHQVRMGAYWRKALRSQCRDAVADAVEWSGLGESRS
jgi:hypothetical protein